MALVLNDLQKAKLKELGIPRKLVIDGRLLGHAELKAKMSAHGLLAAVRGKERCRQGHTEDLWTPSHCLTCYPRNLFFKRQFNTAGIIYVARSNAKNALKIGVTSVLVDRIRWLNGQKYGGASDWAVKFQQKIEHSGRIEHHVHQRLIGNNYPLRFVRAGRTQFSRETFRCSVSVAIKAIQQTLRDSSRTKNKIGTL